MTQNDEQYELTSAPVLDYAPPEPPPRRAWRDLGWNVVDAIGPKTVAFALAVCLFCAGVRVGGILGTFMILASGYFLRLVVELWARSSRW